MIDRARPATLGFATEPFGTRECKQSVDPGRYACQQGGRSQSSEEAHRCDGSSSSTEDELSRKAVARWYVYEQSLRFKKPHHGSASHGDLIYPPTTCCRSTRNNHRCTCFRNKGGPARLCLMEKCLRCYASLANCIGWSPFHRLRELPGGEETCGVASGLRSNQSRQAKNQDFVVSSSSLARG